MRAVSPIMHPRRLAKYRSGFMHGFADVLWAKLGGLAQYSEILAEAYAAARRAGLNLSSQQLNDWRLGYDDGRERAKSGK